MPSTVIVPPVGMANPEISFSAVDLPQPEGPMRVTNSPFEIVRFTESKTVWPALYRLVKPESSTIGTPCSGIMIVGPHPPSRSPANTVRQDPCWFDEQSAS